MKVKHADTTKRKLTSQLRLTDWKRFLLERDFDIEICRTRFRQQMNLFVWNDASAGLYRSVVALSAQLPATPHYHYLPLQVTLVLCLLAQTSLCMCDSFCNECSLMWRRSGVKRRALVRWEARNARFLHHGVHACWLKALFSLIGPGSTIFAYECISRVLRPGAGAPLLNRRFAHRREFISTRLSLWCTASRHTCLFRRIPQTLCPSLILLKPSQAFPAADYKGSTCVSCWQTSVHKGPREGGTLWFKASWRKKMGSIYGEGIGSALWFEGCFWRKLAEKGERCLPVVQNMCVYVLK